MAGVAKQAIVVSISRFANYGLMLISPVVLVRLLSVDDFGRYREFLVYSSVLLSLATFGIPSSLLFFIPGRPERTWQFVRQTTLLTAAVSSVVVLALAIVDRASGGAVVGHFLAPLVAYTLVFANIDFWEYLWLATKRPMSVFAYTTGRLLARMIVVIVTAYFLHSVWAIIWSLIALEAVRLVASAVLWLLARVESGRSTREDWRALMWFCLPNGGSLMLGTVNRFAANIVVAKFMGPAALARYTIGTYVEPIVSTLRNSLSDAILPAMVGRAMTSKQDAIELWQRGTVVASILLLPVGVLLARYADTLIVTAFSSSYQSAVPVLQIFLIVLIRECFDFAVALKAINETRYFLYGDTAALVLNMTLLVVLAPRFGLAGAIASYVAASWIEGIYLGWWVTRLYGVPARRFVPWGGFLRVAVAATLPLVLTSKFSPTALDGIAGMLISSAAYLLAYGILLRVLRVREAQEIFDRVRGRLATRARGGSPNENIDEWR